MRIRIHSGSVEGCLSAPPSKSMAHRALLCAALADGESRITGIAPSEDMRATLRALHCLGAHITYDEAAHTALVRGVPKGALCEHALTEADDSVSHTPPVDGLPATPLFPVRREVDCGESGSTLRFVIPLFSLTGAPVTLVCHGRLPHRPQGVYAALFAARGLHFAQDARGVTLHGALTAGEYILDGSVSSQFISGLLFALPLLSGDSTLHITPPFESRSYVELTLQVLADFGVHAAWTDASTLCIQGNQKYKQCHYAVEGDCSQAAFFAVLAACLPQSAAPFARRRLDDCAPFETAQPQASSLPQAGAVTLTNLRAATRQGDHVIFELLRRCGAHIQQSTDGSVTVHPSREALRGVEIDLADCPDLGPILMVLGLFCAGETVLYNAGRLRVKESDRIAAMETELRNIGGDIDSRGDTVWVHGAAWTARGAGETVATGQALHPSAALCGHGDHRIVMAMTVAVAAANFTAPCELNGAEAIQKSYPAFFADFAALGGRVETACEQSEAAFHQSLQK